MMMAGKGKIDKTDKKISICWTLMKQKNIA